jgi:preprotein translocase subunit YajC
VNVAASGSSGGGSSLLPLLLLVGLFALMYFMVIRPQSQRRKQMQQMQHAVTVGSSVLTIGGLYGTVVAVDDESVTLEVAPGITNRYSRGAIGKILTPDEAAPAQTDVDEFEDDVDEDVAEETPATREAQATREPGDKS